MTTPAQDYEKARLRLLAGIADRSRMDRWVIEHDDAGMHVVAQRRDGNRAILCTIHDQANPDEAELISAALETVTLFLTLRKRSVAAYNELHAQIAGRQNLRRGDFAANAAILCAEPLFHRFLERRDRDGSAIHKKEQADAVLKRLIGITSKTQLNKEERAQSAFFDLRADFDQWKKGRQRDGDAANH